MKNISSVIFGLLTIFQLSAQTVSVPAILKQYVGQSFQKYPRVGEMKDQVTMNEVKVGLGKTAFLPTAMGDLSYRQQFPTPLIQFPSGQGQMQEIRIQPTDNYNASVTLVQPLIDLRVSSLLNKAKSDLETSKDNLESFKITLAYQVAQLYYSIVFLNKSIEVQQEQINLLESNLHQIKVKVKNGAALNYDLVSTEVKYTNAANFQTDLKTQLAKQYNVLDMLTGNTGKDYLNETTFNTTAFNLLTDSLSAIATRNNPDIRIAADKIKSSQWDIQSAERMRLPLLSLQAGMGYKNGFMPNIDLINFNYFFGLGMTIPIFSASRPGFQRKLAVINHDATQHALETQKVILQKDLLNAVDEISKNQKKLAGSDTLIRQAQLAHNLAAERYKFGVITNLELLTAVSNLKDAQLSQLQFEYNLLLSRMDMCRLAGICWW